MKPLVVGQGRARGAYHLPAWSDSRAAKTLWGWFGMTSDEFHEFFDTTNVSDPDFDEKMSVRRPYLVIVGRAAERAMLGRVGDVPREGVALAGRWSYLVLPHPSGRDRLLNQPKIREECARLCQRARARLSERPTT